MKKIFIFAILISLALSAQAGKKKGGKGKGAKAQAKAAAAAAAASPETAAAPVSAPVSASSGASAEVAFSGFNLQSGEVVEISADKMNLLLNQRQAVFSNGVVVKKGKDIIYCDRLEIKYLEAGEINQLKAIGRVKLVETDAFATGEELEYFKDRNLFYLRGNPKLVSKGQIVLGTEMVFDLAHNRLKVTDPEIQFEKESP